VTAQPDPLERITTLVSGEDPLGTVSLVLQLSNVRNAVMVGQALAQRFPTEEDWNAFITNPIFIESIETFTVCIMDIRNTLPELGNIFDPEVIQQAVDQHYDIALEAVEELADEIGCSPAELLGFFVNQ
jgi:hypothetical protein